MDFSDALLAVKAGKKIYRTGWNGSNMYVVYQKGYPDGIAINQNTADATGISVGSICKFLPYLTMKTADLVPTFVPWLVSQSDVLASDWEAYS